MEGLLHDGQPVLAGKNISLDFAPLGSAAASNTLFVTNYNGTEADFRLALSSLAQNVTEVRFGTFSFFNIPAFAHMLSYLIRP